MKIEGNSHQKYLTRPIYHLISICLFLTLFLRYFNYINIEVYFIFEVFDLEKLKYYLHNKNIKLSIIVAMDLNRAIGSNNKLPWNLPNDLKFVKEKTVNKTILMGRKNFESIGRPLPNRRNIVLTRNEDYKAVGAEIINDPVDLIHNTNDNEHIFIFGGEEIYKLFLPLVDDMYVTTIYHEFQGDTFFPRINWQEWDGKLLNEGTKNLDNPYDHKFFYYKRKPEYILDSLRFSSITNNKYMF